MKKTIVTIGIVASIGASFLIGYQVGKQDAEPPTIAEVLEETSEKVAESVDPNEADATDLTLDLPATGFELSLEEFTAQAEDISFDDIRRDADSHVGKVVKKQVKIQTTEDVEADVAHFMAFEMGTGASIPPIWHLYYEPAEEDKQFLAGDTIEFTGVVMPLGDPYHRGSGEPANDKVMVHVRHIDMVEARE